MHESGIQPKLEPRVLRAYWAATSQRTPAAHSTPKTTHRRRPASKHSCAAHAARRPEPLDGSKNEEGNKRVKIAACHRADTRPKADTAGACDA